MKELNHKICKNHKMQKSISFESFVNFVVRKNFCGVGHG